MKEKDTFKFAVTMLTTFATIVYVVNNYVQNNAITSHILLYIIYSIISIGVTTSFLLLVYILIEGIITEAIPIKKSWKNMLHFYISLLFH